MKKYILFFAAILLLFFTSCKNNITNQIDSSDNNPIYEGATYFNGTTNGTNWLGGGVAFVEEDSSLIVRGLYGKLSLYNEIDMQINKIESSPSFIDSGKAIMSIVSGGDAIEKTYKSLENQSDIITYDWNKKEGYISGQFSFKGLSIDSSTISISGNFKIQAAKSGTKWEMNYDKNGNINCNFIK